ncbi:BspA family leucine-rich repeat surface protein [Pseudozobellia sp. WGM2]|uniref:BspA family leucine-rich repeat surface protein n=1 Tax=Pseudozobellia sp. WGM2 TaxID=2787625 RepID=UPI001AE040DE|nr:BspA family leucine-rich repeat surface protein [Pseudozobellia sp. WGM2]
MQKDKVVFEVSILLVILLIFTFNSCSKVDEASETNNAPVISTQTFNVVEKIDPGTEIGNVTASDPDEDTLVFSLIENDNGLFEISHDGVLFLVNGKSLDFEKDSEHKIVVSVSDGKLDSNALITIDVEEDDTEDAEDAENTAPRIEGQTFNVSEATAESIEIGKILANDAEGDTLVFELIENDNGLFEVSDQGILYLAQGKSLDFETRPEHKIVVSVSDSSLDSTAEINIVVIDETEETNKKGFVIKWHLLQSGINDYDVEIGINQNYNYNYTVDWGDGSITTNHTRDADHSYDTFGIKTITITGIFPSFNLKDVKNITVEQWGDNQWKSMNGAFENCYKVDLNAVDVPDLSMVTDMSKMFYSANDIVGDLNAWDVSSVSNMNHFLYDSRNFKADISGWNVGNVNDMSSFLEVGLFFESDITAWDVKNVENMSNMFSNSDFNQNIGSWDVGNVTDMSGMFSSAFPFNIDIGQWNVSKVIDMSSMFSGAHSFNQDLNAWDVGNVTNMQSMFENAGSFNGNISNWQVGKVIDMSFMFDSASVFNGDLSGWNVSRVENMLLMFSFASAFNSNIGNWNVSAVSNMASMFNSASSFDQNLGKWRLSSIPDSPTNFGDADGLLAGSGLSTENYDATLKGWAESSSTPKYVSIYFSGTYCDETSRSTLRGDKSWVFFYDSKSGNCD